MIAIRSGIDSQFLAFLDVSERQKVVILITPDIRSITRLRIIQIPRRCKAIKTTRAAISFGTAILAIFYDSEIIIELRKLFVGSWSGFIHLISSES